MTLEVRPAEGTDRDAIRRIHRSAFPTPAEAELVERLAKDGDLILSLVAWQGGEAIGHAAFSRMTVEADGRARRALGLGPVGVCAGYQGSGAGSALVRAGLGIARATGEEMVFVLGEPEYYRRFGFAADQAKPFRSPYSGPFFMALSLGPEAQAPISGTASYAKAFDALTDTPRP